MSSEFNPIRGVASSPTDLQRERKPSLRENSEEPQEAPRFYVEGPLTSASSTGVAESTYDGTESQVSEFNYSPGGSFLDGTSKRIPRPPNAFILYRREKQSLIVKMYEGIANNDVSKIVGEMWRNEQEDVKDKYRKLADKAKDEHSKMFPNYRYKPRKSNKKRKRRELPSAAAAAAAAAMASNYLDYPDRSPAPGILTPAYTYAPAPPPPQPHMLAAQSAYYDPAYYMGYGDISHPQGSPPLDQYRTSLSPQIGQSAQSMRHYVGQETSPMPGYDQRYSPMMRQVREDVGHYEGIGNMDPHHLAQQGHLASEL